MRNLPVRVLSGVDTATQTGSAIWVGQEIAASFVGSFGDVTANGTIKIQGSNDIPVGAPAQFTPTNFNDIPNATSTVTLGVCQAIVLPSMNFQYIRVIYTRTSGGSTTVVVNMSALGV